MSVSSFCETCQHTCCPVVFIKQKKASVCAVRFVFEINYEHVAFNVSCVASLMIMCIDDDNDDA